MNILIVDDEKLLRDVVKEYCLNDNYNVYEAENGLEALQVLEKENIDLIVLAGYLAIISDELIKEYENRIINIHPSLIPSFCGMGYYGLHVHEAAFKRGVKVSGATVHFVSSTVDGGPIIIQKSIDVSNAKSPEEMQQIVLTVEHQILKEAVRLYCDNKLEVVGERVNIK